MTQVSLAARALRTVATVGVCFSFLGTPASVPAADSAKWWKGNLHTHTLWSDGDDYPDMVVDWYKTKGYHFLALSDHNTIQLGERWIDAKKSKGGVNALEKYRAKFGDKWVESRMTNGVEMVRLKTLGVMQPHFNEAGRFLLIQSEEVTSQYKTWPVHINATNPREILKPQSGDSVLEVIQKTFDNFAEHRKKTGEPMFMHLNHPNFRWGVTAEDILPVKGDKFFEVYNGHPTVYNEGDATHASTDRIWDILLSFRLADLNLHVMYGVGTDDSHNYHDFAPAKSNSGRGWVMVRAKELSIAALVKAMEEGDFYASSGVTLTDVKREKNRIAVEIQAEPGVTYTTQFIGTRKGFDRSHEPLRTPGGEMLRVTHRYSKDVGAVLAEVKGTSASYTLKGDEIYVRAKVISSKAKAGSPTKDEVECAWVQPVVSGVK